MTLFTYQRHGYDIAFASKYEHEFESWFENLAKKLHPGGDCQGVRLTQGDGKIDAFVINRQIVYQCYAPQTFKTSSATAKIKDDFWGVHAHLGGNLKEWAFVHNHCTGNLDKDSLKAINDIKTKLVASGEEIKLRVLGKEALWEELVEKLDFTQLRALFGEPNPVELNYESLEKIIYSLKMADYTPSTDPISQPDVAKLDFNKLGESSKAMIKMARAVDYKVGEYFDRCSDLELGEKVAERFKAKYVQYRDIDTLPPDEIFNKLQFEVGWKDSPDAQHTYACMAILSFFFHQCDIFENNPVQ
ncbi:MAG: hypothetical protein HQ509_10290 [Candidatus Marinimicrobia bacterium]|nr:hypothetical protein [Candidatus Neomarinimicrobiota bacterium]